MPRNTRAVFREMSAHLFLFYYDTIHFRVCGEREETQRQWCIPDESREHRRLFSPLRFSAQTQSPHSAAPETRRLHMLVVSGSDWRSAIYTRTHSECERLECALTSCALTTGRTHSTSSQPKRTPFVFIISQTSFIIKHHRPNLPKKSKSGV